MIILGGLPMQCMLIKLRRAAAAAAAACMKRSDYVESWNISLLSSGRMSSALGSRYAPIRRLWNECNFLRKPTVAHRFERHRSRMQWEKNRLGNQEKSHEDVCLSHMTSGIQWQAMEAHKKVYYQVVNCPLTKRNFDCSSSPHLCA